MLFLLVVLILSIIHRDDLFFKSHGRSHRFVGGGLLLWLFVGACCCNVSPTNSFFAFSFDVILGCLGFITTMTAAKSFPHKYVRNEKGQSGTLHENAIVTQSEMIEHAFYQGLNIAQSLYLHSLQWIRPESKNERMTRLVLLMLVTSPWLVRQKMPVHSFSDNWKIYSLHRGDDIKSKYEIEVVLYRIKKAQYLFYKHVILHGINIYMAVASISSPTMKFKAPPYSLAWRIFWLHLNTSYVMEFFLQSLVKRKTIIRQSEMIWLQRWLMMSASVGATVVLWEIIVNHDDEAHGNGMLLPVISTTSLILNFAHRHHDVFNTMAIAGMITMWKLVH